MLRMTPEPCLTMTRAADWAQRYTPFRFTPITLSQTSSSSSYRPPSSTSSRGMLIPALFTMPSTRPKASRTPETIFSTLSRLVTSAVRYRICPSRASPKSGAWGFTSHTATLAPSASSSSATDRPMPDAPPVTMITRPSRPSQDVFSISSNSPSLIP